MHIHNHRQRSLAKQAKSFVKFSISRVSLRLLFALIKKWKRRKEKPTRRNSIEVEGNDFVLTTRKLEKQANEANGKANAFVCNFMLLQQHREQI